MFTTQKLKRPLIFKKEVITQDKQPIKTSSPPHDENHKENIELIDTIEIETVAQNQTLRQLAKAPNDKQPLCITFLNVKAPFELKPSLIHLLSTFRGL